MSSGGQQPVTQQTQQTKDPWSAAQPHLINAMQSAANNYNANVGYQPWTGQTVADVSPYFSSGWNAAYGIAAPDVGGTAGVKAAQQLGLQQIQAAGQQQNPFLQSILDTNNRRIGDRVNASMSGAGRYGSGAHTDVMSRALAESANPILAQDYTQGLERAGQWAQLMPTLDQAQYAPAQTLMGLGEYYNERAQKQLDDQIKTYNAQQAYPWEQLARYNAIVGGAGGLGGTMTGSQTTPINSPSTLQKLLGGAAAGAGIGGSFGGPLGAGVGAAGGSLLSLL
jgi:hypothetical protein